MRAKRPLPPLVVGISLAGVILLSLIPIPMIAAQEPAAQEPAAPEPVAKAKRPQRWERLREKIIVKDAEYAGTETCGQSRCHADTVESWTSLRHTEHIRSSKQWSEDERSCEGCHGPGSAHLIDRQHGSIARLSEQPEYVAALCNSCHHGAVNEKHFLAGIHFRENVTCGTCHDVHRDHGSVSLLRGPGVQKIWRGYRQRKTTRPAPPAAPATSPEGEPDPAPTPPDSSSGAGTISPVALTAGARADAAPGTGRRAPVALTAGAPADAEPVPAAPAPAPSAPPAPRKDRGAESGFGDARFATGLEKVSALCLGCHTQQRGEFHQNSRHPIFEDRMSCTSCHNPHTDDEHGTRERMRIVQGLDDRCATCHTDKRGPFVFEHDMSATGDGCVTCHQPHGSPNNKLLKLNGRGLCLQCHTDITFDPEHQSRPGNCWQAGCHADLHGSQTSRVFLRAGASAAGIASSTRGAGPGRGRFAGRLMEFTHLSRFLGGKTTAGSSSAEFGSQPEPSEPQPPAPTEPAPATAEDEAARTGPKPLWVEVVGSYQGLHVHGNESKSEQYTVRPSGLFFDALRLQFRDPKRGAFGSGQWTGIDEPRQMAALRLDDLDSTGAGPSLLYGFDRAAFFIEPSPDPRNASDRETHALLLRWRRSARAPDLRFVAEKQRVDAPGVARLGSALAPGALNYDVETYAPQALFPLLGGDLRLQYTREEFDDRTRFLPSARANGWHARYDRLVGANTFVFASYGRATLEQAGLSGDAINQQTRLGAETTLLPRLTLSARLTLDDIRQPNTQNAFVQDRDLFVARLRYRPLGWLSLEGAYEREELDRLNNVQTFVHTPSWEGGWLALRAAPHEKIRLSARHRSRRLNDPPPAEIIALPSTSPLFYDEDDRTDARLTITLPRDALLYINYGQDRRQNDARDVGYRFDLWNAGVSWPVSPVLTLNADWSRQEWSGRGTALTTDPLGLNLGRSLTSDGDAVNLGLAYLVGRDRVALTAYQFRASGGESVRARGFLIGVEPQLDGWITPRFQLGWDQYDDRLLPGLDYSDFVFRVDLARRF
jgi:predicted CXXCH cytochrome family protein